MGRLYECLSINSMKNIIRNKKKSSPSGKFNLEETDGERPLAPAGLVLVGLRNRLVNKGEDGVVGGGKDVEIVGV